MTTIIIKMQTKTSHFMQQLLYNNMLTTIHVLTCTFSHWHRAFSHDVTAAMLVFQFKIILIRLLSGTPTWPPWLLLSWSLGNECKRSIQAGLNLQTLQNRSLKSKRLGMRLAKPAHPLFTINGLNLCIWFIWCHYVLNIVFTAKLKGG
jgi:hypothetical protein